jgi:hypothetical protein
LLCRSLLQHDLDSHYLGFGILEKESASEAEGTVHAQYFATGEVTCEVEWRDGICRLDSHCDGQMVASSYGRDLQQAFYQRFSYLLHEGDRDQQLYRFLRRVLKAGKNTYFHVPTRATCHSLFFPAGLIFSLRQPLTGANRQAWELLRPRLLSPDAARPLRVDYEGRGSITRYLTDGRHTREEIGLIDLNVLLVDVVETVSLLAESGLSLPGKEYRLEVGMPRSRLLHPGESERGYTAFMVSSPFDSQTPQG